MKTPAIAVFAVLACASSARSTTIPVAAGESIQAAINAAVDGDVVDVAAGTFDENIDFAGKAVHVVGADTASVIRGTGAGPVVTFAGAESADAVLDSFTITGGVAARGGGIRIVGSSPTIVRNVVIGNLAVERGSGIYKNRVAALLTDGTDFVRIRSAQQVIAPPRLEANLDGSPRFQRRPPGDASRALIPDHFLLRAGSRPRAVDGGNPDPLYADLDGTRNDIGFTGGPFAAP
jgi:hypothetical protein